MILVTGGAGFIGSNFVLDWLEHHDEPVLTLDALTYAGNLANLDPVAGDPRHVFCHGDIRDRPLLGRLLAEHRPRAIVHLAAHSHVDRSIQGPADFVQTNVEGTFELLQAARAWHDALPAGERTGFRFLHVSTDEVYGSIAPDHPPVAEDHPYAPNSPYAASKAAADHLVRAWHHTYGLPTLITHCTNNYGPRHFPEKLIPLTIVQALAGGTLPVYGDGLQVRDWLYVRDHCAALRTVLEGGLPGRTYHVGGGNEQPNLEVVRGICRLLDTLRPDPVGPYERLIAHVADRPGHDRRYALDATRIRRELGWRPRAAFDEGLSRTVQWFIEHADWVDDVRSGAYRDRAVQRRPRA